MSGSAPAERYRAASARAGASRDRLERQSRRLANLRLLFFVATIALLVWAEARPAGAAVPLLLAVPPALAFLALVPWHRRVRRRKRWEVERVRFYAQGEARVERTWADLPLVPLSEPEPGHPYALDLDVMGNASLAQLLGTVGTSSGLGALRDWLLAPAAPPEVRERQQVVRELREQREWRESLAIRARLAGKLRPAELRRFLAWSEDPPWLLSRPGTLWLTRILPIAFLVLLALHLSGMLGAALWVLPLAAHAVLTGRFRRELSDTFERAFPRQEVFADYSQLFAAAYQIPGDSTRCAALRRRLNPEGTSAERRVRQLERLMELADTRFASMIHPLLQYSLLWDFHVVWLLEKWRSRAGRHVRGWFETLGEVEGLSALATLADENPSWGFPELVETGTPVLVAIGLGHPLLAPDRRVDNNVTVGPPGTFLLVTGSNMSGKSTLLRAIGLNAVLAQAGGPVCATSLRMPPLRLWTSMRISDSLEAGVSFFLAELNRLSQIVEAARAARKSGESLLYLLDEMLQGTNSAERREAARRILRHLLEQGAIGAVTSHDLTLAEGELSEAAHEVHFRETVHEPGHEPPMTFDYRLRPGLATSTNALKLMELIGLLDD